MENARELDSLFGTPASHAVVLEQRIQELVTLVGERQQAVEALMAQLAAQTDKVNALVAQVTERQHAVESLTAQFAAQTDKVNTLVAQVTERQHTVEGLTAELNAIHASKFWKPVSLWRSLLSRLR